MPSKMVDFLLLSVCENSGAEGEVQQDQIRLFLCTQLRCSRVLLAVHAVHAVTYATSFDKVLLLSQWTRA
jgi:hypothetical protein